MKAPGELRKLIASKVGFPAPAATSSQAYPTMSGLPTFTPFPRLPIELRTTIWRAALPCHLHITELNIHNKSITPRLIAHTIFSVNRESRAEAFAVLLNAPPPYSLPAVPEQDIISLDPRVWNDLPHMSVGKIPVHAAVCELERAQRFIATTMVDIDECRFEKLAIDMRFYSPYGHAALSRGPLDFQGRPLKMGFFRVAKKLGVETRTLGGGFYVQCADGEEGLVGLGGRKGQGPIKPVLRVVYVF